LAADSEVATSVLEAGKVVLVEMDVEEEDEDAAEVEVICESEVEVLIEGVLEEREDAAEVEVICESEVEVLIEGGVLEETDDELEKDRLDPLEPLRAVRLLDEDSKIWLVTTVVEISAGAKEVTVTTTDEGEEATCWVPSTLAELAMGILLDTG
jgi:hypothetical protein